jgi:hypothetical protein
MHARLVARAMISSPSNTTTTTTTDNKLVLSENDISPLSNNDMNDVRLRVYMILCKYYLHHLLHIHQLNAVPTRWARVLDATESYTTNDADKQAVS